MYYRFWNGCVAEHEKYIQSQNLYYAKLIILIHKLNPVSGRLIKKKGLYITYYIIVYIFRPYCRLDLLDKDSIDN
jgi:hypothetical protein